MEIQIKRTKIGALAYDTLKSAEAINLVYVNDKLPGISRSLKNGKIIYTLDRRTVRDKTTLDRIKKLVIPPAWENVWICCEPNGHLQATGTDTKNRKQYLYHPLWSSFRNQAKFSHLYDFGRELPAIRRQLQQHLALPGLPLPKILATVVLLMEHTCIRIGNNAYEKLYGSFGLTTLKDKHVAIKGSEMKFSFKGKKGVYHDITLKSRQLARIVRQCRDIPGQELFQYFDDKGVRKTIDSGMVNDYIRQMCSRPFTSKDFRTWSGTLHALEAFRNLGCYQGDTQAKKNVVEALDFVASCLGNTRSVCKKYYVHPIVIDYYTSHRLDSYFKRIGHTNAKDSDPGLSAEEKILLKILKETDASVMAA